MSDHVTPSISVISDQALSRFSTVELFVSVSVNFVRLMNALGGIRAEIWVLYAGF